MLPQEVENGEGRLQTASPWRYSAGRGVMNGEKGLSWAGDCCLLEEPLV